MSTCTVRPVFVVVAAARLTASPMERSGTPLQLRVICEKALCSMALELPPSQKEDNRVGIRILHLQPCFPYLFDVVAHELGSVVAEAYRYVARVLGDIIDAVRDYLRPGEGLEVMVERLAPAPGTADATLSRSVPGTEFPDALADRIFTMSLRHLC